MDPFFLLFFLLHLLSILFINWVKSVVLQNLNLMKSIILLLKKKLKVSPTWKTLNGLINRFMTLKVLISLTIMMLPGCYQVRLLSIKTTKPNPPILKQINLDHDIDCNKERQLCDIIFNMNELMKYICVLEASPSFESSSLRLCEN